MVGTAEELCFSLACWRTKDETMLLISTSVVSCAEALPSNYCNYDLRISYYLSLGISSLILGGFSHVFLLCYVFGVGELLSEMHLRIYYGKPRSRSKVSPIRIRQRAFIDCASRAVSRATTKDTNK